MHSVVRISPKDQSVKRPGSVRTRHYSQRQPDAVPKSPVNRFKVVYIVVSSLVVCSMIAVALTTIDFGGIFSNDDDAANIENPNADLLAEQ